jgi:hypothetical protein
MTFHMDLCKFAAWMWLLAMWVGWLPMTLTAVTVIVALQMCEFKLEWK